MPRKPFLNAIKPLVKLAGIALIEVTVQSLRATPDFDIFAGSSLKPLIMPSRKLLSILRMSAIKPFPSEKFFISNPRGFPACIIFLPKVRL